MKIGFLGSSFDPITTGHCVSAMEAKNWKGLDKVGFMPSSSKRGDKTPNVSDEHRLNMIELAIKGVDEFFIEPYELDKEAWNCYTFETMEYLKKKYPNDELYFILGADLLPQLSSWKFGKELVAHNQFIVVQRNGINMSEVIMEDKLLRRYCHHFTTMTKGVDNNTSSSLVREEYEIGRNPRFYMPIPVADYIEKEGLYRKGDGK